MGAIMNDRITIRISADVKEALERLHREQVIPMRSRQDAFRHIIEDWLMDRGYLPKPPGQEDPRAATGD